MNVHNIPIFIHLSLSMLLVFVGLGICVWGREHLYGERILISTLLVGLACLCALGGFSLWMFL